MAENDDCSPKFRDAAGTPRDIEREMYEGLVAAGLVKPCSGTDPRDVIVPPEALDPSRLLGRLAEASCDNGEHSRPPESPDQPPPASQFSHFLFDVIPDDDDENDDVESDANAIVINLPPPASERLPSLLAVVHRAFCDVRGEWSTDRVIADPALGDLFLRRCWELGAQASAFDLNWTLLYGRKNGKFTDQERARRFSVPRSKLDEFGHASEMAARYVREQQWKLYGREVSLDKILCDPVLASEFDAVAARLAPNYSALEYRWAALGLRKSQRNLAGGLRLREDDFEDLGPTRDLRLGSVPKTKGIYCFRHEHQTLFIGHTESLRRQMSIHFDQCGTRVIPQWLDDRKLDVRVAVAPVAGLAPSRRELVRARQIALHRPQFNWVGDLFAA